MGVCVCVCLIVCDPQTSEMKQPKLESRYCPSVERNNIIAELFFFAVPVEQLIAFISAVNVKCSLLAVETTRNQ